MKDEDTQEVETTDEPVSVEEEIASLIAAGEQQEQDDAENEEGGDIRAADSADDSEETGAEQDDGSVSEGDEAAELAADAEEPEGSGDDGEDDDAEEHAASEDSLTPPEHWSAADKEAFNEQPKEAQEWMLKRHKEIEGDYTRKRQQESAKVRIAEAVTDALEPYRQEFASAGLDEAGAVRQLASWHNALRTSPREAIHKLAATYGIDLTEPDIEDDITDPALRTIQQEVGSIKQSLSEQQQAAQQQALLSLQDTIQNFEKATDGEGKLLHPHFKELSDDMTLLFNMGKATSLDDAYTIALRMRPDLVTQQQEKPKPKVDPVQKAKQAKRAATGVKSSGAVGKRDRGKMSLEDEIASHFQ